MTTEETKKKFEITLPLAIVFGSLVIAGAIVLTNTQPSAQASDTAEEKTVLSVRSASADDHIIGSLDAQVILVEFSDFECPFCALVQPTIKKVIDASQGQVAWVYRNLPLDSIHAQARPAAYAAECVASQLGNDAFWKFSDALFANQKDLGAALYAKTAASLGADPKTFADCVSSKEFESRISADEAEAIAAGGNGTPFVVVLGKDGTTVPFSGALPYSQMKTIVDSVLSKQK